MIEITLGNFSDYYKYLVPLFKAHWEELGFPGTKDLTLDIDICAYLDLQYSERHVGVAALLEGKPVGYLSVILSQHLHHKGIVFAFTDAFMMDKEHRGLTGAKTMCKMIALAEKECLRRGATYLQLVTNTNKDLSKFASHCQYVHSDTAYIKRLK